MWRDMQFVVCKMMLLVLLLGGSMIGCQTADNNNDEADSRQADSRVRADLSGAPGQLEGELVFVFADLRQQDLVSLDLATGEVFGLFPIPEKARLSHVDVWQNQAVIAYAPPPPDGSVQFGYTSLYTMPIDNPTEPTLLVGGTIQGEIYFNPVWSPDGRYIYYSHVVPGQAENGFTLSLERWALETGTVEHVADEGIWPRLSPDGKHLTFIRRDFRTLEDSLYVAAADGSQERLIELGQDFPSVDMPFFSPDGEMIYFGAIAEGVVALNWWERLSGVQVAMAHDVPSDWWRIPVTGGEPELVAKVGESGLYGMFGGNGSFIAFSSIEGVYVMGPDGQQRTRILLAPVLGALVWAP